ncbi:MAG: DUF1385 domain-containing protein, partial [Clostridia bacterium]|nr:DUF1385 domain-containing protein [Clostridia bacterium]
PTKGAESAGAEDAAPTEDVESAGAEDAVPTEGTESADTEAIAPTKPEKSGDKSKSKEKSGGESDSAFLTLISSVLGIALAVLLFIYAPTWITNALVDHAFPWLNNFIPGDWSQVVRDNSVVWRPIIEGVIKMIVFIVYLALCSTMKEIRRLFQFHGAEHKTIFCYEAGDELTVENVRRHKRFHPRCGTSFLMLMLIVGIIAGIIIKGLLPVDLRNNAVLYPLIKLCIIPLIMGVGYELLKLAGKHDNIITRIISAPGMWMQRITVKEPDDEMIECAIAAISRVIPDDGTDMQ